MTDGIPTAPARGVTGGVAVADSLLAHGVTRVFCVPGESFLGLIDALVERPGIELVPTRHEGGAGFMAVAEARLSGVPGVVAVSRGPGASNVTIAIHNAREDGVPLIVLVGQVERRNLGRGAFQEVDYAKTYSDLAKAVIRIDDANRASELMAQAFHVAARGLPGPVVVVVPEDVFTESCTASRAAVFGIARPHASHHAVEEVARRLSRTERPLLVAGMEANTVRGRAALLRCAEAWDLPVAASARQPDVLPNHYPAFVGHLGYAADPALVRGLKEATMIVAVGTHLGDVTSQGYGFPSAPFSDVPLIHVHSSADCAGALRASDLAIIANAAEFLERLSDVVPRECRWTAWRDRLQATYVGWSSWRPVEAGDGVVFGSVVEALSRLAPDDAIVAADAGNFGGWLGRYWHFRGSQRFLNALSGSMGYGVPAAIAACLHHPERRTICFVGDGGFLMTGQELATGMAAGSKPIIVVSDNGSYGTIRMHQEKKYPGRTMGTDLYSPDFAAMARAFGCEAITVSREAEVEGAVEKALSCEGPLLLHVKTSLRHISPSMTLPDAAAFREPAEP